MSGEPAARSLRRKAQRRAAAAGVAYFAGIFVLGAMLGTVRVLLLAPAIGAWGATIAEMPVMLTAAWFYCGWLLARLVPQASPGDAALMGALAFALLIAAELALGIGVMGLSMAQQWQAMTAGAGLAGLAGQLVFAAFPLLRVGRRPGR